MRSSAPGVRVVALAATLLAAGCSDGAVSPDLTAPDSPSRSTTYGATLLECPLEQTTSASAVVGPLGGTLHLNGHRVNIPATAVAAPTAFTLEEKAGNYLEVDIRANGRSHYQFRKPVTVTLSYERCTRSNIDRGSLRIFYIDPVTKQILQDLGGTDDKTARTVTSSTGHLSGYAVGGN